MPALLLDEHTDHEAIGHSNLDWSNIDWGVSIPSELIAGNITLKFNQPGFNRFHLDSDISQLELALCDERNQEFGSIQVSANQDLIAQLINDFDFQASTLENTNNIDSTTLSKLLKNAESKGAKIESDIGVRTTEIVKNYVRGLAGKPIVLPLALQKPKISPVRIQGLEGFKVVNVGNPNEELKESIKTELGIGKLECTRLGSPYYPTALVEAHGDYLLLKVYELASKKNNSNKFKAKEVNLVVTKDKILVMHQGDSEFVEHFVECAEEDLKVYRHKDLGTTLYTFLEGLLIHNQKTITKLQERVENLVCSMSEPLDEKTLKYTVPAIERSASRLSKLIRSQEPLPAVISNFLAQNKLPPAKEAEEILKSYNAQVLDTVNMELEPDVHSIRPNHAALSSLRTNSIGKKLATISAFVLPQLVAAAIVGPVPFGPLSTFAFHIGGILVTAGLMLYARTNKWLG